MLTERYALYQQLIGTMENNDDKCDIVKDGGLLALAKDKINIYPLLQPLLQPLVTKLEIKLDGCMAFDETINKSKCNKKDIKLINILQKHSKDIPIFVNMIQRLQSRLDASRGWFGYGQPKCD
jgi:hypothetical protein